MQITQTGRLPLEDLYENEELIGKHVRVISDMSDEHHRKFGRIVGFTEDGGQVKVYISETQCNADFPRSSLELLN